MAQAGEFNSAKEEKRAYVEAALERIDAIPTRNGSFDGGERVQLREVLSALYDNAYGLGAWSPTETTREAQGAPAPVAFSQRHGEARIAGAAMPRTEDTSNWAEQAPDAWSELRGWWEQTAHDEVSGLVDKMVEYGGLRRATDLTEIGHSMVLVGVPSRAVGGTTEQEVQWLQELGAYFYLRGKFARWGAAIAEGRPVSDDTLHDIAIYTRMVQRIRQVGGWPL